MLFHRRSTQPVPVQPKQPAAPQPMLSTVQEEAEETEQLSGRRLAISHSSSLQDLNKDDWLGEQLVLWSAWTDQGLSTMRKQRSHYSHLQLFWSTLAAGLHSKASTGTTDLGGGSLCGELAISPRRIPSTRKHKAVSCRDRPPPVSLA